MQTRQWFEERIGKTIFRQGHGDIVEREVKPETIDYLMSFIPKGFTYRDKEPAGSENLRVHSGPPESQCISCEG